MQKAQESERSIRRARVSWEQSKDDLEMAKSMIKSNPDTSCLFSSQATINAFSSILQAQGNFQLPAYSSTEMLNQCNSVSSIFEQARSQCAILDSTIDRDLLGNTSQKNIQFTPAFAKTSFEASRKILKIVRSYWRENRQRFFDP